MANGNPRLEVEIGAITSDLKKGLAEAREELRKFSKETGLSGVDVLKKQYNDAKIEALRLSATIKDSLAESLNNAKRNTESAKQTTESYKQSLLYTKRAVTDSVVAINQQRQATEAERTALAKTKTELANIALEKRKSQGVTQALSGSYREAQQRLTALGRSIREAEGGFESISPDIQRQIKDYNDLNTRLKAFDAAMGNNQRNVGNYALGMGNANGVTMEFTRIIQDAPFGMMGIGNNIQQLTANWQQYVEASKQASAAQGRTVTTGALLRNALSSLLSPASLLTLSIAALTSGWVIYEKWQQRSKKASEETQKTLTSYIETLNGVSRAQADGQASALKELTTVEQLYKATQNVNLPMKDRIENAKELIKQGGELFKSTTAEAVVAGRASSAYDALTNSIRQTALAQAYMQKMTDNATKALNNNLNILNEANEIMKLNQQIARQESITTAGRAVGAGSESMESANVRALNSLYDQRRERINSINKLNIENASVLKEQDLLQKGINTSLENGGKIVDSNNRKLKENNRQLKNYLEQVRDIGQKSQFSLDIANSEGLDKEIEKNKQKYKNYLDDLDKIEKQNRGKNVENAKQTQIEINNVRKQIIANQALEEQQIRLKYERDTQDLITSILNDAGLSRIKSRQQELDANVKYYDELANKHRANSQVLQAITEARKANENSINEKWDNKAFEDAQKLYTKIGKLEEKTFTGKNQETLKKQLDERLKQVEDFYKNIAKILEASGVDSSGAYAKMFESFGKVYEQFQKQDTNISDSLSQQVRKGISRGIGNAFTDLYNSIGDLGSNFYQVFSNVFQKLSGFVGNIMSDVLGRSIGESLSKSIDDGNFNIAGLGTKLSSALVLGASTAGKILGGMVSRESKTGQGLAGAISGVASGAAIGSVVPGVGTVLGGVVGGVVGLLGGIFGAKSAKREREKQEELQRQQLAEQKKQTALMERQAMLSYSASVVSQMTNSGVVTSVERDSFGNLVAKIAGKDIELVLERTRSGR